MNLFKAIAELHADEEKLDRVIASLEELQHSKSGQSAPGGRSPRGRKSMGAKERLEVSARMKRYWAGRRQGR
jgi:hypothetical protein